MGGCKTALITSKDGVKMTREALRAYLHNEPLVSAVRVKSEIDGIRRSLCEALRIIIDVGVSKTACMEVQGKISEYGKISKGYGNMIEDTFGVTWQAEAVIRRFMDLSDAEIDRLPSKLTF